MRSEPQVVVLHAPDCPAAADAVPEAEEALRRVGVPQETLIVRLIETEEEAALAGMHGSPAVTVAGKDVDARMREAPASLYG